MQLRNSRNRKKATKMDVLPLFLILCAKSSSSFQLPVYRQNTQTLKLVNNDQIDDQLGVFDDDVISCDQQKEFEDDFFDAAERDSGRTLYPLGTPEGFYVTRLYTVPSTGFGNILDTLGHKEGDRILTEDIVNRLDICGTNVTLPVALILLDPENFPSFSRSRKSCRKGNVVVNRGPLLVDEDTGKTEFDQGTCFQGRVIDRVYPSDVIGIQCRMYGGFYPGFETSGPPFALPVVYEDDHVAIVNKPAGVIVYAQRNQGYGKLTIRAALPFVLRPPKRGTKNILKRPEMVHRLDKPTSGFLVIAKTKPAVIALTKQFEDREVRKTYTAVVNGIPSEPFESNISTKDAVGVGVDVDVDVNAESKWQLIDHSLDGKRATTVWRPLRYEKSLKAKEGTLTLVEMKPKTGRYHQLRRHMAWVKGCPIVGDTTYDGGGNAERLRGRGLFLCSNSVLLTHPYYNTVEGSQEWESLPDESKWANGTLRQASDGCTVEVHASIDIPNKFQGFLAKEGSREAKLGNMLK